MVRSASACRPDWYCANASRVQRRSRSGAAFTMLSAVARTSRCRPARSEASTRSSSASSRSSSSRPASIVARSQDSTSSKARPRQRSSACAETYAARSGSPSDSSSRLRATICSKRWESTSSAGTSQPVALRGCLDRVRPQRLAQPHDAALQRLVRGGRQLVAPHSFSEPVGAHRSADVHREGGQHRTVTPPEGIAAVMAERTQHTDTHTLTVAPSSGPVNGELPRRYRTGLPPGHRTVTGLCDKGCETQVTSPDEQRSSP